MLWCQFSWFLNSSEVKSWFYHSFRHCIAIFVLSLKQIHDINFLLRMKHFLNVLIVYSLSEFDQKMMMMKINAQNFRIHKMMKILHVEHSKKNAWNSVKADILIINVMIFQQTNTLIQKKLILQEVFHDVEMFHWNCLIVCCYQCQWYDHTVKICRFIWKCEFCAKTNYKNDQCSVKNKEKLDCCLNCNKAQSVWVKLCKSLQKVKKCTIHAYNN